MRFDLMFGILIDCKICRRQESQTILSRKIAGLKIPGILTVANLQGPNVRNIYLLQDCGAQEFRTFISCNFATAQSSDILILKV
jgi:hypothetical protein